MKWLDDDVLTELLL